MCEMGEVDSEPRGDGKTLRCKDLLAAHWLAFLLDRIGKRSALQSR